MLGFLVELWINIRNLVFFFSIVILENLLLFDYVMNIILSLILNARF